MKKCNKCGFKSEDLAWDKAYHEITGKWRLYNKLQQRPHECMIKPIVWVLCPKCDPEKRKKMDSTKLQEHIKKEHFGFW